MFIEFTMCFFRERLSVCNCAFFLFGFKGGMWVLIVFVPDYCLSIYLEEQHQNQNHEAGEDGEDEESPGGSKCLIDAKYCMESKKTKISGISQN